MIRDLTGNKDYECASVIGMGLFGALEKAAGEAKKKVDDA